MRTPRNEERRAAVPPKEPVPLVVEHPYVLEQQPSSQRLLAELLVRSRSLSSHELVEHRHRPQWLVFHAAPPRELCIAGGERDHLVLDLPALVLLDLHMEELLAPAREVEVIGLDEASVLRRPLAVAVEIDEAFRRLTT